MSILNPHPIIAQIWGVAIYTHGALFALGAMSSWLTLYLLAKKRGLETSLTADIIGWPFIIGLLVSRVGYVLLYPDQFKGIYEMVSFWQGGLVSYFGLAGGLLILHLYLKKIGRNYTEWMDLVAVSALMGWGVGRWGNYWAPDSVGVISKAWAITYNRVPVQLLESFWVWLLAGVGIWLLSERPYRHYKGKIMPMALAGYAAGRLFIDIWRDENALWLGIKPSQLVCLLIIITIFGSKYVKKIKLV